MEIPEVRRRVRAAIDAARKAAQERRARSDEAARDYDDFLRERAIPVFQTVAAALSAEGHRFKVATPAGSVRLSAESSPDDYIEVALDDVSDPPLVVGRINRGRGRRLVSAERPITDSPGPVGSISDQDVLAFLVREIGPFVER